MGRMDASAEWKEVTRNTPETVGVDAASSASARSRTASTSSVRVTSCRAASVNFTPRPTGSSRGTPASFSS